MRLGKISALATAGFALCVSSAIPAAGPAAAAVSAKGWYSDNYHRKEDSDKGGISTTLVLKTRDNNNRVQATFWAEGEKLQISDNDHPYEYACVKLWKRGTDYTRCAEEGDEGFRNLDLPENIEYTLELWLEKNGSAGHREVSTRLGGGRT
ncbi:hypothetical protein AB0I81_26450 [Nonomuraea sp. NPDC050404]|uniref:hypothetical protein n=1 Tax=Nonomuraea sp. NPDC050404 TaxID=3155783 RepID=UPI0033D9FB7D